ncbi:lyase [Sphingobium sp. BYY-5]|uniref:HEAT repeat domain-containing protein n=1 Tax=Sphingobium sp. BYY-5 TaxID=2926400 RepID=UPI001FA7D54A|nr:lyase [Sphingobium sp. BYY-5]
MSKRYEPSSDFLKAVIAEEVPLSGGEFAALNLERLIQLTRDQDRTNRDWATLLLSQEGGDTPAVRAALLGATTDEDEFVRAEAILGLASRDPVIALPFVLEALGAEQVAIPVLEAAAICAHPSLTPDLKVWAEPSDDPFADELAAAALAACEQTGG